MHETNGKPTEIELRHDAAGRMELVDAAGAHANVEPVRGFPMSDPDCWISICDADGRELLMIENLASLPADTRRVLEQELSRREFVPTIRRIVSVPADTEPAEWDVETDRGRTQFLVNSGDDVRRLGPQGALIVDVQGIRYLIDDIRRLDPASRRILDHFLQYV